MSGEMDSVDTYSSGMGAYGATPFKYGGEPNVEVTSSYLNKDGYLYGAGFNYYGGFGIGNTSATVTSFTKVGVQSGTTGTGVSTTGFKNPIDYDFGDNGIVIDSDGKVWTAGKNTSMSLGWGSSYTSSYYSYFRTVATLDSGNYLPSNYQAVAVSSGGNGSQANLILTSTGALYGAGQSSGLGGASTTTGTFTRIDGVTSLPAATASNPIIDFSATTSGAWVLYKDGSLYYGGSSTWKKLASNITLFDAEGRSSYCYMYNSSTNKIQYSLGGATPVNLVTPTGTVTQVRGSCGGGWGYLNSAGTLFLSNSSSTTAPTASNATATGTTFYQISNVSYFDLGGGNGISSYGIIQNGVTKFWGYNGYGQLGDGTGSDKTYANAVTPSNVDTTYMPNGNRDISNSPPANCHFPRK